MHMIPRIKTMSPRFPCFFLHVYAPRTIAAEPNSSGTMNRLRTALMNPKMAYVLVMSLAGGYDGADGGDVD